MSVPDIEADVARDEAADPGGDAGEDLAELLPAGHIRPLNAGTLIRMALPIAMVIIMVLASVGISYWSYVLRRDETLALADELIDGLEHRIRTEVESYLAPVGRLAGLSVDLLGSDALSRQRRTFTEPYALGVLAGNEQVAISSFADPHGNFLMYVRREGGAIDTKRIERLDTGVRTTWVRRNVDGEVVAVEQVPDDGYDPRTRPWYQGAVRTQQVYWSDVYLFFSSKQPGITVSVPVREQGVLRAVYGLDITLESLSAFLSSLEIGKTGRAVIFDDRGRLVAHPDSDRMLRESADGLRTAHVDEMQDPALAHAYARFRVQGLGHRVLEVNGEHYLNSAASLASVVGRDWTVMLLVPEADFTQAIVHSFRRQLLVSLVVLMVAVLLGVIVLRQLSTVRLQTRRLRVRQQQLGRRGRALVELATDAALRADDSQLSEVLRAFTRCVAQALGATRVSLWRWGSGWTELTCVDAYDRRTGGHGDLARIRHPALSEIAGALAEPVVIRDPIRDQRTRHLDPDWFEQPGIETVLSLPVACADGSSMMLWVEDAAREPAWERDAFAFIGGLQPLLAARCSSESCAQTSPDAAPGGVERDSLPAPARRGPIRSAHLLRARTRALYERLTSAEGGAGADCFAQLTVLRMELDQPRVWASPSALDASRSMLDVLVRELQTRADQLRIGYVKLLGTSIVCASGFDKAEEPAAGAAAIAELALQIDEHCTRALTAAEHALCFRIGLDTGPALGAGLGAQDWIYNLFGAVVDGAASMATSAPSGSIQVSESCHAALRNTFLLSQRGRYYVGDEGEMATYLLLGRS
ncbi:MAG: hypothetical protein KDK91_04985 [Gammaproteobacteria bacterium]|nr:hypothetical protein [Gammaproteobacteria bacterium]